MRKLTWSSLVEDPQFAVRGVDIILDGSAGAARSATSAAASGRSAGTKRTSLVALSPVEMKIRLLVLSMRATPTVKAMLSVSS